MRGVAFAQVDGDTRYGSLMLQTRCHRVLATVVLATTLLVPMAVQAPPANARADYTCYIFDSYRALWRMSGQPSFEAFSHWTIVLEADGTRSELSEFLVSSEPWFRLEIDGVYRQALDRLPTQRVQANLVAQLENGASMSVLAGRVYGSAEFYKKSGGTTEGFVRAVFARALRRPPTASEAKYWSSKVITTSRESVAGALLNSIEARRHRVRNWFLYLIQRSPTAGELATWTGRLNGRDDAQLAAYLVSSRTFFLRSSSRGGCS